MLGPEIRCKFDLDLGLGSIRCCGSRAASEPAPEPEGGRRMQDVTIELRLRTSMSDTQLEDWIDELLQEVNEHLLPPEEVSITRKSGRLYERKPWNGQVTHKVES
jgi:hypothetical protein